MDDNIDIKNNSFFNRKNINNLKLNLSIINNSNYLSYYEPEPCPCPYKCNYRLNKIIFNKKL